MKQKVAFGGGCHWCTEAVFQSLVGVENVEQGYVSSIDENSSFSEAVVIHFNSDIISLQNLIEIHLYTHKSTSSHSMRKKYRSAIYTFSDEQNIKAEAIIANYQKEFNNELVTKVFPFNSFKASREQIQNYYYNNPKKPFCKTFINPKLKVLLEQFSEHINTQQLNHIAS